MGGTRGSTSSTPPTRSPIWAKGCGLQRSPTTKRLACSRRSVVGSHGVSLESVAVGAQRGSSSAFVQSGSLVKPGERRRQPPGPVPEQPENGREEQATHENRVDQDGEGGTDTEELQDDDGGRAEDADREGEEDGCRDDDPADGGHAAADRLSIAAALEPRLAHAAEQEDPVIGRDRKDERREDERDGQVDRGLARVAEE